MNTRKKFALIGASGYMRYFTFVMLSLFLLGCGGGSSPVHVDKNTTMNNTNGDDNTQNPVHVDENTTTNNTNGDDNTQNIGNSWLLKVAENKRMLQHSNGTPFFWLADTAWYLLTINLTNDVGKNTLKNYLNKRKEQGFNVIMVQGSKNGFVKDGSPNVGETYKNLDFLIEEAKTRNMYIGLLPLWNELFFGKIEDNATFYLKHSTWLAERYKDKKNIIWILGGDANAEKDNQKFSWNTIGNAIKGIVGDKQLITFHPNGTHSSSDWFADAKWLDFHMIQTGHCTAIQDIFTVFNRTYEKEKPMLDAEPSYEEISECPSKKNTYNDEKTIKTIAYREVFSGAFGHTYGHRFVWRMVENWEEALNASGASQLKHLVQLIKSRDMLSRIPDQTIVSSDENDKNIFATRGDGYIFVYLPKGGSVTVNLGEKYISGDKVQAWWYNTSTGEAHVIDTYDNKDTREFTTDDDKDIVLVIDDKSKNYNAPGKIIH